MNGYFAKRPGAGTCLLFLCLCFPPGAIGKLSPEQLARLDGEFTPMGAIRAGNGDGLIPQWTGTVLGLPEGVEWQGPGTPYPDPWPADEPLFTGQRILDCLFPLVRG